MKTQQFPFWKCPHCLRDGFTAQGLRAHKCARMAEASAEEKWAGSKLTPDELRDAGLSPRVPSLRVLPESQ